jgi:hypothetical protein
MNKGKLKAFNCTWVNTDAQIMVQHEENPSETTDYTFSGNTLTLSMGGPDVNIFIKIN